MERRQIHQANTPKLEVKATKPVSKPDTHNAPTIEATKHPIKGTTLKVEPTPLKPASKAEAKHTLKLVAEVKPDAPKPPKYEFTNSKGTMSYADDSYHHTKIFKPYDIRESYRPISNDWYTKVKEPAIRLEVSNAETQSFVKYGKMKEELLHEVHLGHGDMQKLWDSGLSMKDVKKFGGELVNDLINQPGFKEIAAKWGQGFDGTNQLIEHTTFKKPDRIAKMEKFLELESNTLTDIFSKDSAVRMRALKKFDEVSDDVIEKALLKNTNLKGGKQEAYYVPSKIKPGEGVIVLKYKDKKQTMIPGTYKYFDDHFGVKP
ncbi:hypothetical protein NOVO_08395 [Rickettsiales bacterium Ac37b]|nr:hypothetical protein NOVO_08395 [Rickettsiales bacterium Ac37b]